MSLPFFLLRRRKRVLLAGLILESGSWDERARPREIGPKTLKKTEECGRVVSGASSLVSYVEVGNETHDYKNYCLSYAESGPTELLNDPQRDRPGETRGGEEEMEGKWLLLPLLPLPLIACQ